MRLILGDWSPLMEIPEKEYIAAIKFFLFIIRNYMKYLNFCFVYRVTMIALHRSHCGVSERFHHLWRNGTLPPMTEMHQQCLEQFLRHNKMLYPIFIPLIIEYKLFMFSNEFRCNSGQCISESSLCDGDPDCYDGSDETITQCISFR